MFFDVLFFFILNIINYYKNNYNNYLYLLLVLVLLILLLILHFNNIEFNKIFFIYKIYNLCLNNNKINIGKYINKNNILIINLIYKCMYVYILPFNIIC